MPKLYLSRTKCCACGIALELDRMYKAGYCKPCTNKYIKLKKRKKKWRNFTDEEKKKTSARARVSAAIKSGAIQKLPCLICGEPKAEGHHEDYNKPLDVIWLCRKHHQELHESRRKFLIKELG